MRFQRDLLIFCICLLPVSAMAMDETTQQRFNAIMQMKMAELTTATEALLEQRYPDHDWEQYDFPGYVYTSDAVEMGYRIAVIKPELLGQIHPEQTEQGIPCYCFCDAMGHRDLLACFLKGGKVDNGYDDHAANCNICYGQAMLAFLWEDAGASHEEILVGMKKKFARLLKMQQEREKG